MLEVQTKALPTGAPSQFKIECKVLLVWKNASKDRVDVLESNTKIES